MTLTEKTPTTTTVVSLTAGSERLTHLHGKAQRELGRLGQAYLDAILEEAERIEAASNSTAHREVTSQMLRDADLLLRRGYSKPRQSPLLVMSKIASAAGGFIVGVMTNQAVIQHPGWLAFYIFVLVLTITSTVIAILKES